MKATKLLCLLSILIFFGFGLQQAVHASITFDEGPHLAVGMSVLRTGDFRLQPVHIHPPLANLTAALPTLLLSDIPNPASIEGWDIASLSAITDGLVWQYQYPARLIIPARIPMLLTGVLLLVIVYRWTYTLAGETAATIAVIFLAFDPNLIAHSALVTTDITATFTIVLTLACLSYYAKSKPGNWTGFARAAIVGLAIGLAQLAKTSGTVILPFVAVIGMLRFIKAVRSRQRKQWLPVLGEGLLMLTSAALILWTGYGFEVTDFHGFSMPAATHFRIFESFREHYNLGHSAFALGQISDQGWFWYFPLAYGIKTPLPSLITVFALGTMAVITAIRSRRLTLTYDAVLLLSFVVVYTTSSLMSTVNIGYRHLLPLLPVIYILTGTGFNRLLSCKLGALLRSRFVLPLLALIMLIPLLRCAPYPLTFFNRIIGDQSNASEFLVDSNLDWGQNWWDLCEWQTEHEQAQVKVAHFSPARLDVYDLDAAYLPPSPLAIEFTPWAPQPGNYAIGATVLQGAYMADPNTYAWFRTSEPDLLLGNALYVYSVNKQSIPDVLIACTHHDNDYFASQYGTLPLRILRPDCGRAEVYSPTASMSHYFIDATQSITGEATEILSLRDADGTTMQRLLTVTTPQPVTVMDGRFDDSLHLMGYDVTTTRETITLYTWWKVDELTARPLSIMAHLVDNTGAVISVDDGLGYPIEQWQTGDIIVQRHAFNAQATDNLEIHTGVYWLDTLERWHLPTGEDHQIIPVTWQH